MPKQNNSESSHQMPSWREVFLYFLFLGFVNVGGPVAQITMMYNHMVERRKWLSKDRFVKIMAFCNMLPGPEALQLAIYVGYLNRKLWGGILAGLTFILPGAIVMIVLSWLYVKYRQLPPVNNALYVLGAPTLPVTIGAFALLLPFIDSRLFQIAWLFLKTGLFSFGVAYASLVFVQRGAVAQYHWLSDGQLLDGMAMSVATPGPFMLFTTFTGYLAGGISGAVLATFFVFLPSFIFVIGGTHYIEKVRDNRAIQAFLAGVSAAVVGVIAVVSLDLIPEAIVGWPSIAIAAIAFLLIVFLKRDVALVAIGGIAGGIIYSLVRAFA